jgi:hypothetical protein
MQGTLGLSRRPGWLGETLLKLKTSSDSHNPME